MKTKYFVMIGMILLLISIGTTITLQNYEAARSYLVNYKSARENAIKSAVTSIKFTSDKVCTLDYETEEVNYCEVCISADYNEERIEDCFPVEPETTKGEIIKQAKEIIRERIDMMTPKEEVKYIDEKLKGQSVSYKIEK